MRFGQGGVKGETGQKAEGRGQRSEVRRKKSVVRTSLGKQNWSRVCRDQLILKPMRDALSGNAPTMGEADQGEETASHHPSRRTDIRHERRRERNVKVDIVDEKVPIVSSADVGDCDRVAGRSESNQSSAAVQIGGNVVELPYGPRCQRSRRTVARYFR